VITDPLVGWACDRTRTALGRRRPWLIASLPVVLLAVWFLFLPPPGVGAGYLLVWTMVVYVGWTMMTIPHQAWGAELATDYAQRSRITAAREAFVIVGTVVAVAMPAAVGEGAALAALAWFTIVLLSVAGLILLVSVPEPPAAAPAPGFDARAGWRLLAANAPFRRLIAAWLANGIANGLPSTLFLIFVGQVLGLPDQAGLFLLAYFVAGIAGIPLWLAIARRIGKHRAWSLAMLWACAFFAAVPLLAPGAFWPFAAVCVATGLSFGADLALPPSMQADVVDLDTAAGGPQRTGLFFAIWGMATKLAYALAVGLAFPLLDLIGFRLGSANAPGASLGVAVLYSLVPVAFKLAAVALVWNFPLDRAAQSALRRSIDARYEAAS
jgi:Na+/melibiose symporter-like transporter